MRVKSDTSESNILHLKRIPKVKVREVIQKNLLYKIKILLIIIT